MSKLNRFMRVGAVLTLACTAILYFVGSVATAAAAAYRYLLPERDRVPTYALGANTLTGMIPTLYEALNIVSREMVGFISAVRRDSNAERAALNQTVTVPLAEAGAVEDITPGQLPANTGDTTVVPVNITITKSKAAPVRWNGEEVRGINSAGVFNQVLADQFADAMRKLTNLVEIDCAVAAKITASRAFGTAGTTPFATSGDLSDASQVARILDDNGAPVGTRQLVLNSAAMANLRGKMANLFRANEAGTAELLRTGYLSDPLQGFALRYSGGIQLHTKGTGSGYLVNSASANVGTVTIPVDTGTGTIVQGDILTIAADTANKYVAHVALAGGNVGIGKPGLMAAWADNAAITVGNNYTPNFAFSRNAIVLATRAPALPPGGDSADDSMMLTDPVSGLTFEVRVYRQYRQVKYEVCLAWGVNGIKPEHVAILLG